MEKLPESRAQAKRKCEPYYFTGLECAHGHIAKRTVTSGNCTECIKTTHQEAIREKQRKYQPIKMMLRKKSNEESILGARNSKSQWPAGDVILIMDKAPNGKYTHPENELAKLLGRSNKSIARARHRYSR